MPGHRRFPRPIGALLLIVLLPPACVVSTDHSDPSPDRVTPTLIGLLKDPDPDLRRTAAQSLGKIGRAEAAPALLQALDDPDAGVRRQAAWALGMLPEESAFDDLSPLAMRIFDSDPAVREAAAAALGRLGYTQVGIELLLERLADPDAPEDSKRLIVAAMGRMEVPSAVPTLIDRLNDRNATLRRWAVAALGEIADEQAVKPLAMTLTKDPDAGVRLEAAYRLGNFGGPAAKPALTAALKDPDESVRRAAAAAVKE